MEDAEGSGLLFIEDLHVPSTVQSTLHIAFLCTLTVCAEVSVISWRVELGMHKGSKDSSGDQGDWHKTNNFQCGQVVWGNKK